MSASTSVTRTERLLNLVIALLAARAPIARRAIQTSVAGYDPEATTVAFERMFERDKDELRSMGIPIDTVLDAHGEVQGYLIDAAKYASGDVSFDVDELVVLNLAALVWDDAVLDATATTAVRKIESIVGLQADELPSDMARGSGTFAHVSAREAALLPLMRAVRDRRVVRFDYRRPGMADRTKRQVDPWSLHSEGGHWYLSGWDHERQAARRFRVSRIHGSVTVTATPSSTQHDVASASLTEDTDDVVTVRVRMPKGRGAELRRHRSFAAKEDGTFTITDSPHRILSLLWRADPDVTAVDPPEVIQAFHAGLARLEADHR